LCNHKGCPSYGKSIKQEIIEEEFEALLHTIQPTTAVFHTARGMREQLWANLAKTKSDRSEALETEQNKIEQQIRQLTDRIMKRIYQA